MKKLASAVALAAAALCASAPAHADIVISFSPSSSTINVGDTVKVDMTISGLDAEILSSYDFNLLWNTGFVTLAAGDVDLTPGCTAMGAGSFCAIDSLVNGNLDVQAFALDDDATLAANQANSFVIASFTFTGAAAGLTTLTLGANPDYDQNFVGLGFNSLQNVSVGSAEICVRSDLGSTLPGQNCGGTPGVPEPASYGLAGVALLAAGWAGRGRRRTVKAA